MDTTIMCTKLPTEAPEQILDMALNKHISELGGELTLYKRVSIEEASELAMLMTPEAWAEYYTLRRNRWAAECTCTICGETWHTSWHGGPLKSIIIIDGEDGITYPCLSEEDGDPIVEVSSNDGFLCPMCGNPTTLQHASKFRNGRSWQLMISSVDNIGEYSTIFYWLIKRTVDSDGYTTSSIRPWHAYVIDEKGRLRHFIYSACQNNWRFSKASSDAYYSQYNSMGGNLYNYAFGGFSYDAVPSLDGCTGEKTGLRDYVMAGGILPVLYMRTWRRNPALENLVVSGWTQLVEQKLQSEAAYRETSFALLPGIDLAKTRPHEMLHMDKQSFKALRRKHPGGWSSTEHTAWMQYLDTGGQASAEIFDCFYEKFKLSGVEAVLEIRKINSQIDFPKIDRYFAKQNLDREQVQMLLDTWRMAMKLFGRTLLTHEEMWPRNLMQAHERLMQHFRLEKSKGGWEMFLAAFHAVYQRYRALEWTDGDLCIVIPRDNGDLIREGDTLRHCVATYGESHISGKDMIFFVRRYRRPERCYYTLDYNMISEAPVRRQLHGYGNERHGPNKEYSHTIPQKVKDFCDRWEREVLIPWFAEQKRAERRQNVTIRKDQNIA